MAKRKPRPRYKDAQFPGWFKDKSSGLFVHESSIQALEHDVDRATFAVKVKGFRGSRG